ncbi:hypothetical protein B0H11DRAFT_2433080 [Mycena galericulata]|nr:hypothetical protein B0H11DRAFT_2433080 [Mycena galericulata]
MPRLDSPRVMTGGWEQKSRQKIWHRIHFNDLPPEIIMLIFTHCRLTFGELEPEPQLSYVLSAVCKSWEEVAWNTRAVWKRTITIKFPRAPRDPSALIERAAEWIQRGDPATRLTIRLDEHQFSPNEVYPKDPMHDILIPFSDRIASLDLKLSRFAYKLWWEELTVPFDNLTTLTIRDVHNIHLGHGSKICPPGLLLSPSLRHLSVLGYTHEASYIHILYPMHFWGVHWHNLTILDLSGYWIHKGKWIDHLRHCINLEECHMKFAGAHFDNSIPLKITLPNLRLLHLILEANRTPVPHPYDGFSALILPGLVEFKLENYRHPRNTDPHTIPWPASTMLSFFEPFGSTLETLSLVRSSISVEEYVQLLGPMSALRVIKFIAPKTDFKLFEEAGAHKGCLLALPESKTPDDECMREDVEPDRAVVQEAVQMLEINDYPYPVVEFSTPTSYEGEDPVRCDVELNGGRVTHRTQFLEVMHKMVGAGAILYNNTNILRTCDLQASYGWGDAVDASVELWARTYLHVDLDLSNGIMGVRVQKNDLFKTFLR